MTTSEYTDDRLARLILRAFPRPPRSIQLFVRQVDARRGISKRSVVLRVVDDPDFTGETEIITLDLGRAAQARKPKPKPRKSSSRRRAA